MNKYLRLMRVHHYIKNILIFAALVCSGNLLDLNRLIICVLGFLAFCMCSSFIYVVNDIKDVDKDRVHPTKKNRPIASGQVSVKKSFVLCLVLICIATILNFLIFKSSSTIILLIYIVINLGYSFGLKNIPIVDLTILVSGFLLRILYGAIITGIDISNWLYLTVIVFATYFALGKRRNEIIQLGTDNTRVVLKKYPISFLDKSMSMCITLGIVFYSLWSMDTSTVVLYNNDKLVLTVPIVLLITLRYSMDIEDNSDGDPVEVLVHDKALIFLCLFYALIMINFLYL